VKANDLGRLTDLFRRLGARDPEQWARSQVEEGIEQLGRFLFLRAAWSKVVSESDASWISAQVAQAEADADAPYAGVGQSLKSLLAKGATAEEITDVVRGKQAELLFEFCYLLEDPNLREPEVRDTAWGLFLLDESDAPTERLGMLHESVLETDPTGREMRPRAAG